MTRLPLETALKSLFPAGVATALVKVQSKDQWPLFHVEQSAIARVLPTRLREFTAGRHAAHLAQSMLGFSPRAVAVGPQREPIWPAGLWGSISHSGGYAAAAVTAQSRFRSLGLDLEQNHPLPTETLETILTVAEREWLQRQPRTDNLETVIFSAKECAYKAQYALSERMFGFEMLDCVLDLAARSFVVTFTDSCNPFKAGDKLQGRFALSEGMIATGLTIS